jgi:hypothetical protein
MTAYDEVDTHAMRIPRRTRIASLARLFGMAPAEVERCRVLEIRCGDAANLIARTQPAA